MCILELKGLKFHSFIGHFDEEKEIGNRFNIDIQIKYDCQKASKSDKLSDALDYVSVYKIIKQEMNKKCNLVENVNYRIMLAIFKKFSKVEHIWLKITKISPKIGGVVDEMSIITEESVKVI